MYKTKQYKNDTLLFILGKKFKLTNKKIKKKKKKKKSIDERIRMVLIIVKKEVEQTFQNL